MIRFLLTILAYVALSACMVGPNYQEPVKQVAPKWNVKSNKVTQRIKGHLNWWNNLNDPTLALLIEKGYQHNLTLQQAGVNVLKARAQLAEVVGELYPQQQALGANFTNERIGGSSLQNLLPNNFNLAAVGGTASWELDFWGKYRRAILSNDAAFLSSFAAYDQALITLTSDIATTYINIRVAEELIEVTKKNIKVQAIGFDIATSRFKNGETSELDVEQAKTELFETESILPKYRNELQRQKDALAVLLGTTPDKIDSYLTKSKGIPKAPKHITIGIPKETLIQRPDIYQARMDAISQLEAIGAIKATLYPALSLAGTFYFSSNDIGSNSLNQLFNWNNRNTTFGPSIAWPVLNYGQITNQVRVQDANYQISLLNYMNAVLKAQQEVQDNISGYVENQKTVQDLNISNRSAIRSTHLALVRYREGESDYTPVLDSERQQLRVETSLTNSSGDIAKAVVALYRSLGGGWQIRQCNDVVPTYIKRQMAARTNWGSLLNQQNHIPPKNKTEQLKQRNLPNW